MNQKITPNLWFDGNAKEAVEFYTSVFPGSTVASTAYYPKSVDEGLADFQKDLAGEVLQIDFSLAGHDFTAINADDTFTPTDGISFLINFDPSDDPDALQHLDQVWDKLIDGGKALIPIAEQPYSKRYGWVKDKYGFGWQLMLTDPDGEPRPCVIPDFLFSGPVQNQAEEAMKYYAEVFGDDSKVNIIARYEQDQPPVKSGSVMFGEMQLAGQWFAAMDSAVEKQESFSEALSLSVTCIDQVEIDYFWSKLSHVPESEQCGWCKDKFGVSWQIIPEKFAELMSGPDAFKILMNQHKIVIAEY
ncbi:MAG: VOC family protein [Candidatus Saccharimonadales bacterium]